jgi:hypothetical protein
LAQFIQPSPFIKEIFREWLYFGVKLSHLHASHSNPNAIEGLPGKLGWDKPRQKGNCEECGRVLETAKRFSCGPPVVSVSE